MDSLFSKYLDSFMNTFVPSEKATACSTTFEEAWALENDFLGKLATLEEMYWGTVYGGLVTGGIFRIDDSSPIFKAIEMNRIDFLLHFFSTPGADTEITLDDIPGLTPLVYACASTIDSFASPSHGYSEARLDIVGLLISKGANVNSCAESFGGNSFPGVSNVTALYFAVKDPNLPLIRLLLENGADPRIQMTPFKFTVLHQAAYNDLPRDIFAKLIQSGADINSQDCDGNTPLIIACAFGSASAAKLLINEKADVNIRTKRQVTALHAAVYGSKPHILLLLLRCGANGNVKTIEGHTPLDMAIFMKKKKMQKILTLAKGTASLSKMCRPLKPLQSYLVPSFGGLSAFHCAALNNYIDDVKYFLVRGDDVNIIDAQGQTPLFSAVMGGCVEIVDFLLKSNADPNKVNVSQVTPLHMAVSTCMLEISKCLIKNGAKVDYSTKLVPLLVCLAQSHFPSSRGTEVTKAKLAEILIQKGAPFDEKWKESTPQKFAIRNGDKPLLTVIEKQFTLFRTIKDQNLTKLRECLSSGAIVNCRSIKWGTPLQYAAVTGSVEIVQLLIENGADVNFATVGNSTALHYAAKSNLSDIVLKLLLSGAAYDVRTTKTGKTPLEICLDNNSDDCETAVLLKTVKAMFDGDVESELTTSSVTRDLLAKVRNFKGLSVDDVRRAKQFDSEPQRL